MMNALTRLDWFKLLGASAAGLGMLGLPAMAGAGQAPAAGGEVYTLPPLPYPVEALEPAIDAQTVEIHHDRHHAGYVKNLNATLGKLQAARKKGDFSQVEGLLKDLAFNGSGHLLHTLYWYNLSPKPTKPAGALLKAIDANFGSLEALNGELKQATVSVKGNGWGALAIEPMQDQLFVLQVQNHENNVFIDTVPILVIDAWEHAYYLKYQNRRADYVDAVMKILNWDAVAQRFDMINQALQAAKKAAPPA